MTSTRKGEWGDPEICGVFTDVIFLSNRSIIHFYGCWGGGGGCGEKVTKLVFFADVINYDSETEAVARRCSK